MKFKLQKLKAVFLAIGLGAALVGCKTNTDRASKITEVVTETPEEETKENVVESLIKAGAILEQEASYKDYYKIIKSSTGAGSSINDYFEEKNIVPYYDAKCSPVELAELMKDADFGHDGYTYGNISLGSAFCYNHNIDENYKTKILTIIYDYLDGDQSLPTPIAAYNLANLSLKYVDEDEDYYSKFDPVKLCIYINRKYVRTGEQEKIALTYALKNACYNAYLDVDGKTVYCSLTNFYYDSKNDKLLEVGNTYRDFIIYYKLYLNNIKIDIPSSQVETLYNFCTTTDLLKTGSGTGTPIVDFSTYLKSVVPALQDQFPSESKEYDIAKILIDSDLGKKEAVHKAIDYCKTINYGIDTITQTIEDSTPWITNLDSLKDNLIEYSNNSGRVR